MLHLNCSKIKNRLSNKSYQFKVKFSRFLKNYSIALVRERGYSRLNQNVHSSGYDITRTYLSFSRLWYCGKKKIIKPNKCVSAVIVFELPSEHPNLIDFPINLIDLNSLED